MRSAPTIHHRGFICVVAPLALACLAGCPGDGGALETPIASPSVNVKIENQNVPGAQAGPPMLDQATAAESPASPAPAPPSPSGEPPAGDQFTVEDLEQLDDMLGPLLSLTWDFSQWDEGWKLSGGAFADETRPNWSIGSRRISGTGEGPWYFVAPDRLSGDRSDLYGQRLSFVLARDTSSRDRQPGEVWQGVVALSGNGWSIGWGDIAGSQHDFSSSLSVRLDESETWIVVASPDPAVPIGSRASQGVFDEILGNLYQLRIFGQRGYCDGTTTLDSVRIEP